MIEKGRPEGLVSGKVQHINDCVELWYETSDYSELALFAGLNQFFPEQIQHLFARVQYVRKQLESFLLDPDKLCLDPQYIYCNKEMELFFVYTPSIRADRSELWKLFHFFLRGMSENAPKEQIASLYLCCHELEKRDAGIEDIVDRIKNFKTLQYDPEEALMSPEYEKKRELAPPLYSSEKEGKKGGRLMGDSYLESAEKRGFWKKKKSSAWKEKEIRKVALEEGERRYYLRNLGEIEIETMELDQTPFYIGSDRERNDLWISDPCVSRRHARLVWDNHIWYLEDLDSANGSKWNHTSIRPRERQPLSAGDLLEFAGSLFVFDCIRCE